VRGWGKSRGGESREIHWQRVMVVVVVIRGGGGGGWGKLCVIICKWTDVWMWMVEGRVGAFGMVCADGDVTSIGKKWGYTLTRTLATTTATRTTADDHSTNVHSHIAQPRPGVGVGEKISQTDYIRHCPCQHNAAAPPRGTSDARGETHPAAIADPPAEC
jgi:hypothetical protein